MYIPKHGDVRPDGKVFWGLKSGGHEVWMAKDKYEQSYFYALLKSRFYNDECREDKEKRLIRNQKALAFHRSDYRRSMFQRTRKLAALRGIPFDLESKDDLPLVTHCPIFKVPLTQEGGRNDFSPSIDRLVPSLGYTKGNIIVVSELANRIKSNATPEQVLAVGEFYVALMCK